jgi:hypothetical protein
MADLRTVTVPVKVEAEIAGLDDQQRARVVALHAARSALLAQSGAFSGTAGPDATDLVQVAAYIITGQDPRQPLPVTGHRLWFRRRKAADDG